ncbi:hypothetical protein F4678DRAFT_227670 [Xylaria arbuscula]|nr:hypothetical protein F4678DRAFT_227670 [Xylaria arbuscula]
MELSAHQMPLGPFGTYACHMRSKPHHAQPLAPSSSSSSPRYQPPREGSSGVEGSFRDLWDENRSADMKSASKPWSSFSKPPDNSPQKEGEGRSKADVVTQRFEEEQLAEAMLIPPRYPSSEQPEPALQRQPKRIRTSDDVDGPGTAALSCKKRRLLLHLVTSRLSRPFSLPATHILIRESGDNMPVLHRIQQLAALGARPRQKGALLVRKAAILNRVRIGVRQAAVSRGHTVMADLAARANALHHGLLLVTTTPTPATFPTGMTNTNTSEQHVPTMSAAALGQGFVPPVWRPHTTSFHPPIDRGLQQYHLHQQQHSHQQHHNQQQQQQQQYDYNRDIHATNTANATQRSETNPYTNNANTNTAAPIRTDYTYTHNKDPRATTPEQPPPRQHIPVPVPVPAPPPSDSATYSDEEDNTAFPAASFRDRYADLSDDDMDDVYADFGVLFGSSPRSPDRASAAAGGGGSPPVEEQFYEEYLDELDGIPWVF